MRIEVFSNEGCFRKPTFYPLNYKGLCRFAQIFKELLPIIQRIDWAEKSVTLYECLSLN